MTNTLTGPVASVNQGDKSYGIDDAIELMRKLPKGGTAAGAVVVNVVRTTLESTGVDVDAVVNDGQAKLERIETRVETLEGEVADLETQVQRCRERIEQLETDIAETVMVKERLLLAQKSGEEDRAAAAKLQGIAAKPQGIAAKPQGIEEAEDIPPTRVSPLDGLINED